jgi:hypothetical protein
MMQPDTVINERPQTEKDRMACKRPGVRVPLPPPSLSSVPQGSPHDCYENKFTEHGHNNERRQRALNNLTPIEVEPAFAATEAALLS